MNEIGNFLEDPRVTVQVELEEKTVLKIVIMTAIIFLLFFSLKYIANKIS